MEPVSCSLSLQVPFFQGTHKKHFFSAQANKVFLPLLLCFLLRARAIRCRAFAEKSGTQTWKEQKKGRGSLTTGYPLTLKRLPVELCQLEKEKCKIFIFFFFREQVCMTNARNRQSLLRQHFIIRRKKG